MNIKAIGRIVRPAHNLDLLTANTGQGLKDAIPVEAAPQLWPHSRHRQCQLRQSHARFLLLAAGEPKSLAS
jgi:hypothetical protein